MALLVPAVALALALLASPGRAANAPAGPPSPVQRARLGIAAAVTAGLVAPADAARYRAILERTASALPRLEAARAANLRAVLGDVAAKADAYTAPRALALFSMLDLNTRYFGTRLPPAAKSDVVGPDLVVYRYFPGHGLQFHPLAEFGTLNAHLAAGRLAEARRLVAALRARAVDRGDGTTVWEYEFHYAGGRPPWTSGMAQAVAAQSLARASNALADPSLLDLARRARAALATGLLRQLSAGPWVRLYSFNDSVVLNAQLQAAVAVRDFARIAADPGAGSLADAMTRAARTLLPRLDTGYWTLYAFGGGEESRAYHDYVVFLLGRLRAQTADPFWSDTAARFRRYETQPPLFRAGPPGRPAAAAPQPATAPSQPPLADAGPPAATPAEPAKPAEAALTFSFWLSKASSVVVSVGPGRRQLRMSHGWHTLTWRLPRRQPGVFPVTVQAQPVAGPSASAALLPLVVLGRPAA